MKEKRLQSLYSFSFDICLCHIHYTNHILYEPWKLLLTKQKVHRRSTNLNRKEIKKGLKSGIFSSRIFASEMQPPFPIFLFYEYEGYTTKIFIGLLEFTCLLSDFWYIGIFWRQLSNFFHRCGFTSRFLSFLCFFVCSVAVLYATSSNFVRCS